MSESQRRKLRRRRKFVRGCKRTMTNIVLAPARMPRLTVDKVDRVMRFCEVIAVLFVAVLMLHMAAPQTVGRGIVIIVGLIFAALLAVIGLSDYQDKLVEYELYGFKL